MTYAQLPANDRMLVQIVRADPVCAAILDRAPSLGLPDWWLTAGAVFQNVWNAVAGRAPGWGIKDYDVFYFDPDDLSWEGEDRVIRAAQRLFEDLPAAVEMRNEARVHLWYAEKFGTPCAPLASAREAIESFAAYACSVGVTQDACGTTVFAPYGLHEVFSMHLRPNRRLAPRAVYEAKVREYAARWPSLTIDPW